MNSSLGSRKRSDLVGDTIIPFPRDCALPLGGRAIGFPAGEAPKPMVGSQPGPSEVQGSLYHRAHAWHEANVLEVLRAAEGWWFGGDSGRQWAECSSGDLPQSGGLMEVLREHFQFRSYYHFKLNY